MMTASSAGSETALRFVQARLDNKKYFKKKLNASSLGLPSIPQSGGGNVKTLRWGHRLQRQNLFIAFTGYYLIEL